MKNYCLLKNGKIMPTHYENGELRRIFQDKNNVWFIKYGEFSHGGFIEHFCEIIKFADTMEELLNENNCDPRRI